MTLPQPTGVLDLGGELIDGVGATDEEEIHGFWTVSSAVTDYLEMQLGCPPPKEPDYSYPELKLGDLTTTNSAKYTEAFAKRTAWLGYLWTVLSDHEAKLLELDTEMQDIERRIRSNLRKTSTKVTRTGEQKAPPAHEMDDIIGKNPRHRELKKEALFHRELIKRLSARVNALLEAQKLTSRQVEIRRQEIDLTGRSSRINGAGGIPVSGGQRFPVKK